jgi:hypothetical protein
MLGSTNSSTGTEFELGKFQKKIISLIICVIIGLLLSFSGSLGQRWAVVK